MKTKPEVISSQRWVFLTEKGKVITVIMKVRQFTEETRQEFPEGYKINWIAYDEENPTQRIILDNHHGKNLHWHDNKKEENFSEWVSLEETKKLFWKRIIAKFGLLINELNE